MWRYRVGQVWGKLGLSVHARARPSTDLRVNRILEGLYGSADASCGTIFGGSENFSRIMPASNRKS